MQNLIKGLLYLIGLMVVFVILKYRSKKFWFIKSDEIEDYPIARYKVGSLILWFWVVVIIFGIIREIVFKNPIDSKIFLIPFLITIIYELFGATPTVAKSKHKINLDLDLINIGSFGMDLFGSWIGKYANGIIVYFYFIDYNSIKVKKLSRKEIILTGIEKQKNIPIDITLKSKPSINYFYPLLENINENYI